MEHGKVQINECANNERPRRQMDEQGMLWINVDKIYTQFSRSMYTK